MRFQFNTISLLAELTIIPWRSELHVTSSHLLIVLSCLPQRRHDLLLETAGLCSAPADALALGVVNVPKVVQRSSLAHLTHTGVYMSPMSVGVSLSASYELRNDQQCIHPPYH